MPVLVVHSDADRLFPLAMAEALANAYGTRWWSAATRMTIFTARRTMATGAALWTGWSALPAQVQGLKSEYEG